jgi:predicted TIM-barrel fold metal-dependent hydrolase
VAQRGEDRDERGGQAGRDEQVEGDLRDPDGDVIDVELRAQPERVREDPVLDLADDEIGEGQDSEDDRAAYDYDPLWSRCRDLGVAPSFHGVGYGWGSRVSATNYVHNHLGNFASSADAVCRGLFLGGVPKRFPTLTFAFMEGGRFSLYA